MFGAILGPLALVILFLAPPGRCGYCDARVRGWSRTCTRCGRGVYGPRRDATADARGDRLITVVPTQRVVSTGAPTLHPFVVATALNQGQGVSDLGPIIRPASPEPGPDDIPAPAVRATPSPAGAVPPATIAAAAEPAPVATSRAASKTPSKTPSKTARKAAPKAAATSTLESAPTAEPAPTAAPAPPAEPKRGRRNAVPAEAPSSDPAVPQPIGGGVYYSGTAPLSAGLRYSLRFNGPNLQVLGPHDRDPRRVAFERSVSGADADVTDDRLVISLGDGRNTTLLVFVAVEGGRPAALAQMIRDAALANGSGR